MRLWLQAIIHTGIYIQPSYSLLYLSLLSIGIRNYLTIYSKKSVRGNRMSEGVQTGLNKVSWLTILWNLDGIDTKNTTNGPKSELFRQYEIVHELIVLINIVTNKTVMDYKNILKTRQAKQ